MAPTKPSPLAALLKQGAARHRAMAAASAGSAFSAIDSNNEKAKYGFRRSYHDLDGNKEEVFSRPVAKRVNKPKKVNKPKTSTPANPPQPIIESWRPAGGDKLVKRRKPETLTDTLGLARISTWRLPAFQEATENLVEQHGLQFEEVTTTELVHGGESVTDVFMKFRSELVAETVKGRMDGQMVEGRKLQVKFA